MRLRFLLFVCCLHGIRVNGRRRHRKGEEILLVSFTQILGHRPAFTFFPNTIRLSQAFFDSRLSTNWLISVTCARKATTSSASEM